MSHFLRTQVIYNYILQYHQQNNLPPTMREIALACCLPLGTVFRHLDWLEARGYIIRHHTTRSLRLLKPLQTDEEHVYTCLVDLLKRNGSGPSANLLHQASYLSSSRVKNALQLLVETGLIHPDPENPHLFYPAEPEKN
jgi:DNA-binding IclR family transcriptional regulator